VKASSWNNYWTCCFFVPFDPASLAASLFDNCRNRELFQMVNDQLSLLVGLSVLFLFVSLDSAPAPASVFDGLRQCKITTEVLISKISTSTERMKVILPLGTPKDQLVEE
jgi:hypothetical protein